MRKNCDKCGCEIPVNEDSDSIEDMRAVQERFGRSDALDVQRSDKLWHPASGWFLTGNLRILRIAAKHSDTFNPATMDKATFAKAVIDRGMVVRDVVMDIAPMGTVHHFDRRNDNGVLGMLEDWRFSKLSDSMTAITREQMNAEIVAKSAPKPVPAHCAKCGSDRIEQAHSDKWQHHVICLNCQNHVAMHDSPEYALDAWNKVQAYILAAPKQEETEDMPTHWNDGGFLYAGPWTASNWQCNRRLICWLFADGTTHDHYRRGEEWATAVRMRKE